MCLLKHKTLRYGSAVPNIPEVYMTLLHMYIIGLFFMRRVGTNLLPLSFASDIHALDDIPEATYKACATQLAHSLQNQQMKYVVTKKHKDTALGSKMVRESFGRTAS